MESGGVLAFMAQDFEFVGEGFDILHPGAKFIIRLLHMLTGAFQVLS